MLNQIFSPALKAIDLVDRKLTYASMKLMAYRMGVSEPIHPKNVLRLHRPEHIWFEEFLPNAPATVLDVGAGSGSYSVLCANRGLKTFALEKNPKNIQLISELKGKLKTPDLIEIIDHNLEGFPYPIASASVDIALCTDVIEHLHRRKEHLRELARILKPGGKIVIAAPNRVTSWKNLKGRFGLPVYADDDHKIEYTREEFLAELASEGFTDIEHESTIVIDAPINGILDLMGPISMTAYEWGYHFKHKLAHWFPNQTSGWRLIVTKR